MRRTSCTIRSILLASFVAAGGCAPILPPTALTEIDDVRETPAVAEAEDLAPSVFAKAEKLRQEARIAYEGDDLAGSQILAEQALAAYEEAVAAARAVRAEERRVAALAESEAKRDQLATIESKLQQVQAAVRAADKRLEVLRELQPLTPSDDADPAREKARAAVVATLVLEAQLLCGASELLARSRANEQGFVRPADAIDAATKALTALEERLAGGAKAAPIDQARRTRAACLAALTAVRRAKGQGAARHGDSDRLLTDLSQRGLGSPRRDDRGVVVTLRAAGERGAVFERDDLTEAGSAWLEKVGEIASAHAAFPIMVVVHHGKEADAWRRRAASVAKALRARLGASRVAEPVSAGAADPIVDPEGRYAARNDRVEIIFVSPRPL